MAIITTDSREHYRDYTNPQPYFGTAPAALLQGMARVEGVEVHVLSCAQQQMVSPPKLAPNIWFHSLHVPKMGWLRTGYQGCVRAVRRVVHETGCDIAHGQGTERDCAADATFAGIPNVLTVHGNMRLIAALNQARPFTFEWIAARLERFILPRTSGVVCITRYTESAVRDLAKRTWLVPNAVDSMFFDVARIVSEPPVVLCVGVICARKNQIGLIRALDALAQRTAFRLIFLGDPDVKTEYAAEFRALVAERSWCESPGFASRTQLKEHFARASVLVLPSFEDNCPMVVLEAMAAGVPVVAANVGGVPELVQDNVTGLLCDPNSDESMMSRVALLLHDSEPAARLAASGKEEALRRFHPLRIAQQHVEIYREVLDRTKL